MNPNYIASYALLGRLKDRGVSHCVISPGSRSTPLAFVANELLDSTIIIDERSAGFVALGISESTKRPCVVITTSGSAPTHLYPSVVEAHHSNVGMIVISADRPHEIRGIGAPQTIDQHNLYGSACSYFVDTKCPEDENEVSYWENIADKAFSSSGFTAKRANVSHINMGMREPLVPSGGELEYYLKYKSVKFNAPSNEEVEDLNGLLNFTDYEKVIVTIGRNSFIDSKSINLLRSHFKCPVLTDVLSGERNNQEYISNYDSIMRSKNTDNLKPDVILQFGDPLTSKIFNQKMAKVHTIAVKKYDDGRNPWDNQNDTFIASDPNLIVDKIVTINEFLKNEEFLNAWKQSSKKVQKNIFEVLEKFPESEPSVFFKLGNAINVLDNTSVLLASSMPVRYAEWFWSTTPNTVNIYSHRGTNGIDGMISSTIGIAKGTERSVVTVLGDVAFSHDLGALPVLNNFCARHELGVSLIIINNQGGAIFNHLEQANSEIIAPSYEKIMMTPPNIDIAGLCSGLSINYLNLKPNDIEKDLRQLLEQDSRGLNVIEIEVGHNSGREFMSQLNDSIEC